MANRPYLAMTAAEFISCTDRPPRIAWMACHFSAYGRGLSNVPKELPTGSMLILNDRIEPQGIDPELVVQQLKQAVETLACSGVLLDFQRPGNELTRTVTDAVCKALDCPVAVSSAYGVKHDCAVFLPPPDLTDDVEAYFRPWQGRDIWLEIYDQWQTVAILGDAVQRCTDPPAAIPPLPHYDAALHCRYAVEVLEDRAIFTLHRGMDEWLALNRPISNFIALWQDYHMR